MLKKFPELTLIEALEIILDLASESVLDDKDVDDEIHTQIQKIQTQALELVEKHLKTLQTTEEKICHT